MGVKRIYRNTSEGSIASYSYLDIAEGTGIVLFYGVMLKDSSSSHYELTTQTSFYSKSADTSATHAYTADEVKMLDIDFDTVFNTSKRIRGKMIAAVPHNNGDPSTANKYSQQYVIVRLRKWDGTTETEIASAQSETYTGAWSQQISQFYELLELNIPNIVNFKAGDTLRVTIEIWSPAGGMAGNGNVSRLLHDPKDRTSSAYVSQDEGGVPLTSQLKFAIPFRLDL